jgi:hypothetical protein
LDSKEWLQRLGQFCEQSDWDAMFKFRRDTNQAFAGEMDCAGLKEFYEEVIRTGLDDNKYEVVKIDSVDRFQKGVAETLNAAKSKISTLSGIKGVYFEYFFDGGDSCTGNVFLCTEYSEDDDYWGAEFEQDGFIEGPSVFDYLNFDPEFKWDDLPRYIGEEYANGILLAACMEEWARSGIQGLPFGFAQHDHQIVRMPAI